jgi:hypothetical protein
MNDCCYICYETATELSPFIENACKCKGSMKIHEHCYERIRTNDLFNGRCPTCNEVLNTEPAFGKDYEIDNTGLTYTRFKTVIFNNHREYKTKHGYTFTYVLKDGLKKLFAYELFNNGTSCGKIEIVYPGIEKEINLKMTNVNEMIQHHAMHSHT